MVSPGLLQFVPNKIINVRSSLSINALQERVIFTGLSVEAGNRRISAGCQAESSRLFFPDATAIVCTRYYCSRLFKLM